MNKVAILYFCTGEYSVFWKTFYSSAEENFLPDSEKNYFVFTDKLSEIKSEGNDKVHIIEIPNLPWPLSTLLRYYFVLQHADKLKGFDYVVMANANLNFRQRIDEHTFLPDTNAGQNFTFIDASANYSFDEKQYPYDKREATTAYIPEGAGKYYFRGGLLVATYGAFLFMCHEIDFAITQDLCHRVIAIWHDESHINHFALGRDDIKILPNNKYLAGSDGPDVFICAVDKELYFDLDFKAGKKDGNADDVENKGK